MKWLLPFLLLPLSAFGTITATDRGTGSDNTTGTSLIITGVTMAVGSTGILVISMDNASGASGNLTQAVGGSYTDTAGNIWYVRGTGIGGTALANVEGAVLTSQITNAFSSSFTLTISFNTTTLIKTWAWIEAVPTSGNAVLMDKTVWGSITPTTAPTIGSDPVAVGQLIVGMAAAETDSTNTWTGDGDTTNGSWSTKQNTAIGTGAAGASVLTQTKVTNTSYGTQTFNPTIVTSVDIRVGYIILTEVAGPIAGTTQPLAVAATGDSSTGTSTTITVLLPMPAGSLGVLAFAADNAGLNGSATNLPASFTDSKSNTWTRQQTGLYDPGVASAGVEVGLYTGAISTGLVVGDTLTVATFGVGVPSKSYVVWKFSPTGAGSMSYVSGGVGTCGTCATTSPTITTSSITSGDYVIGMVGAEGVAAPNEDNMTGDSGTTNGNWQRQASVCKGSGAGAMAVTSQWKKVTATATQTYNPTIATSSDTFIAWISINDSSPTGLSAAQKAAFFMLFP